MSQENVEMIERMYAAFHRGDAEGALANFDPEVEAAWPVRVDVGIVRGREGVSATVARWVGAWDEWREEIEEIRDLGCRVLVSSTHHGRSKGTRIEVETRYAVLYEVHGGKIVRMAVHSTPADALEAAGLRE